MDPAAAFSYLDEHINLEAEPSPRAASFRLDRMRRMTALMGEPQHAYPVLHITGTNGKGSTARMLTCLLAAQGLSVGTYTSPHLERVNERLAWNGEPIGDPAFAEVVESVALVEPELDSPPSYFEILTMAALRWFADIAVDVAVVEVGLGGRWDSTNVADGAVAVVTNVALDHAEVIGPTLGDIAREKAGIVKPGSHLVLGETQPALRKAFEDAGAATVWRRGDDFGCTASSLAHGGRVLDLRTPGAEYHDVYVPVHGVHQADNAALALAAAEAFFAAPLHADVVSEAFAAVRLPGRMEVMSRAPVCLIDGAHNPAGARALAVALAEEFPVDQGRILVLGLLRGRDPSEMLEALDAHRARLVISCVPPSPRALPAQEVAAAATAAGVPAEAGGSVQEALTRALSRAEDHDQIVVTGSLYTVGAARTALLKGLG